ncbi:Nif3-like dinuclear metal center hexameric protein [Bacillus marinisedimentorum]|uniref:Nif3-like dinuclear metal center hexameric protein n=1 Tax=Bacillus marinisedimentorum TaxID=1821260 RepID=UPI000872DA9D|nr:Nif3-like dinuclear metal center hexameric protein [Bacillus marinisedimentorum]
MKKAANGQEIIQAFEAFSPKAYAMEGDKIGLHIGTLNKPVTKVLTALDVTEEVVDEAAALGAELIIAHHPLIFHPLKKIATDTAYGRIIEKCLQQGIAVYAAHTNLDVAPGGVNDLLAERLGLGQTDVLVPTIEVKLKKLAVFVPEDDLERVRDAVSRAGAGHIGNYSHCTFQSPGTGTFLPQEGTNPYIGSQGKMEYVKEVRLETSFPEHLEKKVLAAMVKSHPYEEPAFDIYPLENKGEVLGLGRVGYLPDEMTLEQFAEHVKLTLDVPSVRIAGNMDEKVKKVAVLGGDGNKYWSNAKMKGADVYVTGDVYYHVAHDAVMQGLNVIDPGHNVEKVMKKGVKEYLDRYLSSKNLGTDVYASKIDTEPFTFR